MVAKAGQDRHRAGQDFRPVQADPAVAKGHRQGRSLAPRRNRSWRWLGKALPPATSSWRMAGPSPPRCRRVRHQLPAARAITAIGLGANRPQDAIYPTSTGPDLVTKYDGQQEVRDALRKGQLPPVDGFWSLTMYDKDYFFVDNPNRYAERAQSNSKPTPTDRWTSHPGRVARQDKSPTGCPRPGMSSS